MSETNNNKIIITYEDKKYDVTKFDHPGEGIRNCYLFDYRNKDISEDFEHYHYTDLPFYIMEKVNKDGEYENIVLLNERNECSPNSPNPSKSKN